MALVVFAIHAHPDDIEYGCAGTMMLLKDAGCQLHYMTVARGDAGSMEFSRRETARVREKEARNAASFIGAFFHPAITNDFEVFYTINQLRKLLAAIREAAPDILLVPSPEDYMEDHMNASRLAVSAAFCRAMPNVRSRPRRAPVNKDVVIYHAMPHGLKDGMRRQPTPDFYVDITIVMERKEKMLSMHESQKAWLDKTQGMESYLALMRETSAAMGKMSGSFQYAEGWRRHNHLGLSARETDPLREILREYVQ
jgi:LmbE family N-acetylglucosaminyl deacetylase